MIKLPLRHYLTSKAAASEARPACTAARPACCCREQPRLRRVTAGLLHTDNETSRPQPGKRRSVLLLLSRLLVGTMLLVMGYHQVRAGTKWLVPAALLCATLQHWKAPDVFSIVLHVLLTLRPE